MQTILPTDVILRACEETYLCMKIEEVKSSLQSTFTFVFILDSKIQDAAAEAYFYL